MLVKLEKFDEAKAVLQEASRRGFDSSYNHALLFSLAFLDRDAAAMQTQLRAAASKPDRYLVLAEAARAAIASGQIETSRSLYAEAIAAARSARINDYAGGLLAEQALGDALLGDQSLARERLDRALREGVGIETTWPAALAAAFSGNVAQAIQLADRYRRAAPPAADVQQAAAPLLDAAVALAKNDGRRALDALTGSAPYDRVVGPWLPYVRGMAYAEVNDHARAAAELRSVIDERGNQPTHPLHTFARLQLARTLRAGGQLAEARQAYADFVAAWQNGDTRHPLLIAANREASALRPVDAQR
jgi:hypothetical protein